jgi:hypothetical protein
VVTIHTPFDFIDYDGDEAKRLAELMSAMSSTTTVTVVDEDAAAEAKPMTLYRVAETPLAAEADKAYVPLTYTA